MADKTKQEQMLITVMHLIADKFKNQAVLKGGMLLRLLNSPRTTQDIDYVFTLQESRKVIAAQIKQLIEQEGNIVITETKLNSRGIIIRLASGDEGVVLEISMIEELTLPPEQMSTETLSYRYNMGPRIIAVMSVAEAYANKIAASIERSVMRDLYDLVIYQPLTSLNREALKKRFDHLQINKTKPKALSFKEGAALLRKRSEGLTQEDLQRELKGLVPADFMQGGLLIIKNSLNRLCQELEYLL